MTDAIIPGGATPRQAAALACLFETELGLECLTAGLSWVLADPRAQPIKAELEVLVSFTGTAKADANRLRELLQEEFGIISQDTQ